MEYERQRNDKSDSDSGGNEKDSPVVTSNLRRVLSVDVEKSNAD
jgi:hypothetical protein